jgi:hypothetical protein
VPASADRKALALYDAFERGVYQAAPHDAQVNQHANQEEPAV